MIPISTIEEGVANYIDNEVMAKFPHGTWQKVAISSLVGMAVHKYVHILQENRALQTIGIVEGDKADIEAYATQLKKFMPEAGVSIEVPMLGEVILKSNDVDDILMYISKAERSY